MGNIADQSGGRVPPARPESPQATCGDSGAPGQSRTTTTKSTASGRLIVPAPTIREGLWLVLLWAEFTGRTEVAR